MEICSVTTLSGVSCQSELSTAPSISDELSILMPKSNSALHFSRRSPPESHITQRPWACRMSDQAEGGSQKTPPKAVPPSYSPKPESRDSSDSLGQDRVDRWDIDSATTRLWDSPPSIAASGLARRRADAAALLWSFDQQFGAGGVESSRPNLSPAIVDPPNFSPGQSSSTNTASQRWPSCPRCGANVRTRPSLQTTRCPRLAA